MSRPRTAAEISLQGQIGAHISWALTPNRSTRTKPAREQFLNRFQREVDPEGKLPPDERARRAEHLRKAYFLRLALASAKARREVGQPAVTRRSPRRQDLGGAA